MNFVHPSTASTLGFLTVVIVILALLIVGVFEGSRHTGENPRRRATQVSVILSIWVGTVSAWMASGVVRDYPLPAFPLFFAGILSAGALFGASRFGAILSSGLPLWSLVGFQAFRLPLELVLHSWAQQGTVPETMTWTGQNLDIITGAASLVLAPFAGRSRGLAWFVNVLGIALLINVGRVAMMSSPLPFAWDVTPKLQLALYFPYSLIGSVCVAGAVTGHVVLTRALLR